MAKIEKSAMYDFMDGINVGEAELDQNFELIRAALNDNFDRLVKNYSVIDANGNVKATQNLNTAINYMKFKEGNSIILSLDTNTSTLTIGVVDGSISTAKLTDLGVTTAKLADQSVSTVKIKDGAVTLQKIDTTSLDGRYYTESEIDTKVATLNTRIDQEWEQVKRDYVLTATINNQTVFTLPSGVTYQVGKQALEVVVGGVPQFVNNGYTESSSTSFTLAAGVPIGTKVFVTVWNNRNPVTTSVSPQDFVNYQTETDNKIGGLSSLPMGELNLTDSIKRVYYFVSVEEKRFNGSIQAAVDATPAYGTLYFQPDKVYNFEDVNINKPIFIEFNAAEVNAVTAGNKNIINIKGSKGTSNYILSSNVNRRDRVLTLTTTPSDIAAGDLIVLTDDKVRPNDNTPEINTEVHEVESVDTVAKTITLKDFVRLPKSVSATVNVYKFNPVENVVINNPRLKLKDGATGGTGIYAEYVKGLIVNNIKMEKIKSVGVSMKYAYFCKVSGFHFKNPQSPGTLYGVRAEKALGIAIENGLGVKLRHTVDFHNAFDCLVDDVIAMSNTSTAFFISHNGYDGDITLRKCRAYDVNSSGYGFGIHNQGLVNSDTNAGDPYASTFYGLRMYDCYAQIADVGSMFGLRSMIPLKESLIQSFITICSTGNAESVNSNAGIQMLTADNDVIIDDFHSYGFRDGIDLYNGVWDVGKVQTDKSARVRLRNMTVKNSKYAILANHGIGKYLEIDGLTCDNVSTEILRAGSAKFRELSLKNVSLVNCPGAVKLFQSLVITDDNGCFGEIKNITSDTITKTPLTITASKQLTSEEIYFNQQDKFLFISSVADVTMATYALQDSVVEGHRITLVNVGTFSITIPSHAKLITASGANVVLATKQKLNLVWHNGAWREV